MKRHVIKIALLWSAAFSSGLANSAQAAQSEIFSADLVGYSKNDPAQGDTSRVFFSSIGTRHETTLGAAKVVMILNRAQNLCWIIDEGAGQYAEAIINAQTDGCPTGDAQDEFGGVLSSTVCAGYGQTKSLQSGSLNGRPAARWGCGDPATERSALQWYDEGWNIVVKEETRSGQVTELRNITAAPQAGELFAMPTAMQKISMAALMQNLQSAAMIADDGSSDSHTSGATRAASASETMAASPWIGTYAYRGASGAPVGLVLQADGVARLTMMGEHWASGPYTVDGHSIIFAPAETAQNMTAGSGTGQFSRDYNEVDLDLGTTRPGPGEEKWHFVKQEVVPPPSDFEKAKAAYDAKDYPTASVMLHSLAEKGDDEAQWLLGHLYREGDGVPQDYTESAKWYAKAAEQGDAGKQNALGAFYNLGTDFIQDRTEAAKWYRKAAEQGDQFAQTDLAELYFYGRGVPQSDEEALKWYEMAAKSGWALPQKMAERVREHQACVKRAAMRPEGSAPACTRR